MSDDTKANFADMTPDEVVTQYYAGGVCAVSMLVRGLHQAIADRDRLATENAKLRQIQQDQERGVRELTRNNEAVWAELRLARSVVEDCRRITGNFGHHICEAYVLDLVESLAAYDAHVTRAVEGETPDAT